MSRKVPRLGKDRRVVVHGAVLEAKNEMGHYLVSMKDLGEFT
jgi:hypothetical protein